MNATGFQPQPSAINSEPQLSTPAAIQATARSFYKVGKGFLGDLASNIKEKYPPVTATHHTKQKIHDAGQHYQQQPWLSPNQHDAPPIPPAYNPSPMHGSHMNQNVSSLAAGHTPTASQTPYTAPTEYYPRPAIQSPPISEPSHHTPPTAQHAYPPQAHPSIFPPQVYQRAYSQQSTTPAPPGTGVLDFTRQDSHPQLSPGSHHTHTARPPIHIMDSGTAPVAEIDVHANNGPSMPTAAPSGQAVNTQSVHQKMITRESYVDPASPPPVPPQHTRPDWTAFASRVSAPVASAAFSSGQNVQVEASCVPQHPVHSSQDDAPLHGATDNLVPQHDPLGSLSAQMGDLNVRGDTPTATLPSSHRLLAEDDRPRAPPQYQVTGPDWEVLPECPEARTVNYSLDWYRFLDVPDYLICTRCYTDHVAGTGLAGHFERIKRPEGSLSRCVFWAPRVREVLWKRAVQTNDIGALVTFLKKSVDILACKGLAHSTGADGVKYFSMTENEVDGFIACEECYEDWVVGTPFEPRFSPYPEQQGENDRWICDLAVPYVRMAVQEKSKQDRWSEFVEGCTTRMSLPVCEGIQTQSNHCNWYQPRRKIEGMHICEACYMDKLALTRFADEFERHQPREGFDGFMDAIGEQWTCALSDKAVNMSTALGAALYQRNFDVFWDAADAITKLVPCTKHGIVRGKWWTVAGGCPDLDVCEACYHGILVPSGLVRFFEPAERDATLDIVCNFCPESHRFVQFVDKLAEALDKGVFSYYADHVKTWAGVPVCPGIRSRKEARWWGYPDATFCPDCYLSFVAGTSLADALPVRDLYDERTMICQMSTPRMRKMWLACCAAGDPGSAASQQAQAEFRAFAQRRLQIYDATVPRIEMIEGMRLIRMQQAMHQGQLSIMYSGMNSMASLTGTTDGYLHGNSSLGWYETEHGATAASMRNNMAAGMAGANRMEDWMELAQLQTMWLEVE